MNWLPITKAEQIDILKLNSADKPAVIFKHSTRCSISKMVLDRLERNAKPEETSSANFFFLDLISYRDISNRIAEVFDVVHESPQVIIVKNGNVTYHNSHMGIDYQNIIKEIKN